MKSQAVASAGRAADRGLVFGSCPQLPGIPLIGSRLAYACGACRKRSTPEKIVSEQRVAMPVHPLRRGRRSGLAARYRPIGPECAHAGRAIFYAQNFCDTPMPARWTPKRVEAVRVAEY